MNGCIPTETDAMNKTGIPRDPTAAEGRTREEIEVRVLCGDCREIMRGIPSESIDCAITSPPYFGQRNYGASRQIGLEKTPEVFVAELTLVFEEVRRILRPEGVLWLNIGDSYNNRTRVRASSHKPIESGDSKRWSDAAKDGEVRMTINVPGVKEKDLFGIPWKVAFALQNSGWLLRQEIIWSKPVGKLDVAPDRPATRHENLFLFAKSKAYHFDKASLAPKYRGSVWEVSATGREDHGASFPPALVEPCILAGCPEGWTVIDPFGGAGTVGLVAGQLKRNAVLIEINREHAELAKRLTCLSSSRLELAL